LELSVPNKLIIPILFTIINFIINFNFPNLKHLNYFITLYFPYYFQLKIRINLNFAFLIHLNDYYFNSKFIIPYLAFIIL
jgi:hypothetical protein